MTAKEKLERKRIWGRAWSAKNRERLRAKSMAYKNIFRDEINARQRAARKANPEKARAKDRVRYLHDKNNPARREIRMLAAHAWRRKHPEKRLAYERKRYAANIDQARAKGRGNYRRYHARALAYANRYTKKRYHEDPSFKMSVLLRSRVYAVIKGRRKDFRISEVIGCTVESLRLHIESQFKPGMTWDNHGVHGWHVDHRKPCCEFDLRKLSEVKLCFHFSNLQPLWSAENLAKGGKYTEAVA